MQEGKSFSQDVWLSERQVAVVVLRSKVRSKTCSKEEAGSDVKRDGWMRETQGETSVLIRWQGQSESSGFLCDSQCCGD